MEATLELGSVVSTTKLFLSAPRRVTITAASPCGSGRTDAHPRAPRASLRTSQSAAYDFVWPDHQYVFAGAFGSCPIAEPLSKRGAGFTTAVGSGVHAAELIHAASWPITFAATPVAALASPKNATAPFGCS